MDLHKLKCFYQVALSGNYVLAGKIIKTTSAAIGRNVRDLEKELDCQLFRRKYHGVALTPEGHILFEVASKIFDDIRLAETILKPKEKSINCIKILATVGITSDWLSKFIPSFLETHPNVDIEISSLTSMLNFRTHEHDVYIGNIEKNEPNYIYHHIKDFRYNFYASQEYLKKNGVPKTIDDLKKHRLIEFNIKRLIDLNKLNLSSSFKKNDAGHRISIDSTIGEYQLAEAGVGIACLCEELSYLKSSSLVRILQEFSPLTIPAFYVFHETYKDNPLVKDLLETLKSIR